MSFGNHSLTVYLLLLVKPGSLDMAANVHDKRRRPDGLIFTPVSPTIATPQASPSVRSPTRRKAKVHNDSGDRATTRGTGILRSSSSPMLYRGEQMGLSRMQPLSPINQQFTGGSRTIPTASRNAHPRSSSQQQLHSTLYHTLSPPGPGQRHSFAPSQANYYQTSSPYSGSDADEDDNETLEDRPLLIRTRSGSTGNIISRRVYNNSSPLLPFSPAIVPPVMARQNVRPPETENGPVSRTLRPLLSLAYLDKEEISRSKSSLALNASNPTLAKTPNGQEGLNDVLSNHPIVIGISGSSIQFSINMDRISPLLFQCLCTLAAIPAMTETFALLMRVYNPQANSGGNTRLDYIASIAWVQSLCPFYLQPH